MALSLSQQAAISKLYAVGNSDLGIPLTNEICTYLLAVIVRDLGLSKQFPELPKDVPPFFTKEPLSTLRIAGKPFQKLLERLFTTVENSDTYFYCLASLHKARLKYERILKAQPIPTIDQVGPRGLLQFGTLSPRALAAFLFWRKWIFDIDNRAGQETGYVFEPILAHAIGGVPVGAKKSPIKRGGTGPLGRQVDCVREVDKRAYEFKLRVTIAASGQGRWGEEMEFPKDCRASGYTPVLIVLDPTPNPKLDQLVALFKSEKGESYIGDAAWEHLEKTAGSVMATFIEKYVRTPIRALLKEAPSEENLPPIRFSMSKGKLTVEIEKESLTVDRDKTPLPPTDESDFAEDADDQLPTPS
jgi:hypothetical protein